MAVKVWTFILFFDVVIVAGSNHNCDSSTQPVVRLCNGTSLVNQSLVYIDFTTFNNYPSTDSCSCIFTPRVNGSFKVQPHVPSNNPGRGCNVSIRMSLVANPWQSVGCFSLLNYTFRSSATPLNITILQNPLAGDRNADHSCYAAMLENNQGGLFDVVCEDRSIQNNPSSSTFTPSTSPTTTSSSTLPITTTTSPPLSLQTTSSSLVSATTTKSSAYTTEVAEQSKPEDVTPLIRMCRPVTISNVRRYTIEFYDFEQSNAQSCHCSFIAPSRGLFEMAPTTFTSVNGCGTKIEITLNNVLIPGGSVQCRRDPLLPAEAYPGENVTVSISTTSSSSSTRIAPYCYVATFPVNITFTCTNAFNSSSTSNSTTNSLTTTTVTPPKTNAISTSTTAPSTSSSQVPTVISQSSTPISMSAALEDVTTARTVMCEQGEEDTCSTTGLVVGIAMESAIICILIGVITFLLWRRQQERLNDERSHVYMQCTSSTDVGKTETYESINRPSSSNVYLNTAMI